MTTLLLALLLTTDCPWLSGADAELLLGAPPIEAFTQPNERDAAAKVEMALCSYRTTDRSVLLMLLTHDTPALAQAAADRHEAEAKRQNAADRRENGAPAGSTPRLAAPLRVSDLEQIHGSRARFTGSAEAGSADYRALRGRRTVWLQLAWRGEPQALESVRARMRRVLAAVLTRV